MRPDYVINGGGIINVAGEIRALDRDEAFDPAWVDAKLDRLAADPGRGARPGAARTPPHPRGGQRDRPRPDQGSAEKKAAARPGEAQA
jgi:leucine dehydrogenase